MRKMLKTLFCLALVSLVVPTLAKDINWQNPLVAELYKKFPPSSKKFQGLDPLEKYFLTQNKQHWNDIQDKGGLSGKFFFLPIFSAVADQGTLFIDSQEPPASIRAWAEPLCGINPSSWDIVRSSSFTSGKGSGVCCDVNYQPLDKRSWSIAVIGPHNQCK